MFLTSLEFVFLLLPITCLSYHWANARLGYRYGALVLLAGNVLFLWYWNWFSVLWLFGLALINWLAGRRLRLGTSGQKWLLAAALALNIIQLGVFKYTAFFLCGVLGLAAPAFLSSWVVPIGLSFFTFQQIAYLVECSRKTVEDHCIVDFLIYSTFFPYILSGPIVLPQETLRQLTALRRTLPVSLSAEEAFCALSRFTYGLAKKILLANQMEVYVGKVFDGLRTADTISLWIGVFAFSLQIYFDFSGYSDMALGVGCLFGFPLPENFNSPYKAMDIDDFWRRWHISLTRFLKQYVYIPLGGNRCSSWHHMVNIMTVFLLSGLWHGANWTYVIWGAGHGILTVCYKLFKVKYDVLPAALRRGVMVLLVSLLWIIFRSPDLAAVEQYFAGLFSLTFCFPSVGIAALVLTIVLWALCLCAPNSAELVSSKTLSKWRAALLGTLFASSLLCASTVQTFIYVNF